MHAWAPHMYCFKMFALISLFQFVCVCMCFIHSARDLVCVLMCVCVKAYIEAKVAVFYGVHVECTRSNGNTYCMLNVFNIPMSSSSPLSWCIAKLSAELSHISAMLCLQKIKGVRIRESLCKCGLFYSISFIHTIQCDVSPLHIAMLIYLLLLSAYVLLYFPFSLLLCVTIRLRNEPHTCVCVCMGVTLCVQECLFI